MIDEKIDREILRKIMKKILEENNKKLIEKDKDIIVVNMPLLCFLDNECDITKCKSEDYQSPTKFIIRKDVDITKYQTANYTISDSIIPNYFEIFKKGKGKYCPNYENKCRATIEAFISESQNNHY